MHGAGQGQRGNAVVAAAVGNLGERDDVVTRHAARGGVFVGQAFD